MMFAKLSFLALSLPLVSALTFITPTDVVSGKKTTFAWTLDGSEPSEYFITLSGYIEQQFLGNVTNPKQTNITATPEVPAGEYVLTAQMVLADEDYVFARSAGFKISAEE